MQKKTAYLFNAYLRPPEKEYSFIEKEACFVFTVWCVEIELFGDHSRNPGVFERNVFKCDK